MTDKDMGVLLERNAELHALHRELRERVIHLLDEILAQLARAGAARAGRGADGSLPN